MSRRPGLRHVHAPAYRSFLAHLRGARLKAGLTQAEVAKHLGKPQSYVAKSESGERRVDVVELHGFAKLYRRPLDFFVA